MQAAWQDILANLNWERILSLTHYWVAILLVGIGLFTIITKANFIKKIIGLTVFQMGVFILYISLAKVSGGTAPILKEGVEVYSNPLPHVLILTAIVVGIATTAVALSLVIRIREAYGSIEEDEVLLADRETDQTDHAKQNR